MKFKLFSLGVTAGLFLATAGAGHGQSITIANNLFSSGSVGNYNYNSAGTYNNPTSWTTVSTYGCFSLYSPASSYVSGAPSGANIIESFSNGQNGATGGGYVYQTLTNDYVSGDSYTLTVLAGGDNPGNHSQVGDELVLWNTNLTVEDSYTIPSTTSATGALTQYSLTFSATSNLNGTPIVLGFLVPSQSTSYQAWMAFTDFTLTQNPPATSYLWASSPINGNWSNGTNWVGGTAPNAGSALTFDASSVTTLTNDIVSGTNASLTFSNNAPAYTVNGNAQTISTGIYNQSTNTQTINTAIADPNGLALTTTNGGGNLLINGVVSGSGGVAISGGGTTTLSAANTYSGSTTVSGGALVLSGSLTNSAVSVTGATFSEPSGGSISGSGGFSQSGSSTSTLAGTNTYTGATTISGGSVTNSGSLSGTAVTVSGGSYTESSGSSRSGSSGISVSAGNAILAGNNTNVTGASSLIGNGGLTLQANAGNTVGGISYALSRENAGFTFQGSGTLSLLSDSNVTFAGGNGTAINAASTTLSFFVNQLTTGNSNQTISFAPGGIATFANTTFNVSGATNGYTLVLPALTAFTGAGSQYENLYVNANGANFNIGGLTSSVSVTVGGSGNTTFSGAIASGSVSKSGSGTLILPATNTFTSGITISAGAVSVNGAGNLGSGSYAGTISDSGAFIYGSSANQTLSAPISGTGSLIANGTGTLTLSAANTYTGKTTISSETVSLGTTGSLASTNVVLAGGTLDASGQSSPVLTNTETLSGSGTVKTGSVGLTLNGKLSPGVGSTNGLIAVTGNWTLGSVSTTTFKIGTPTTAGTTYDALTATGTLTYNGSLDIVINTPSYGTYDIFSAAGYANNFTNVVLSGFSSGNFTNTGSFWTFTDPSDSNTITFTPGSGVLQEIAVPEPSSLVLLGVAMFCALVIRHRISRNKEINS